MSICVQLMGSMVSSDLFYDIDVQTFAYAWASSAAVSVQCLHKYNAITNAVSKWHTGCSGNNPVSCSRNKYVDCNH